MARESGSFWSTIPGFFTALGAFIGSIAALVTALNSAGILSFSPRPSTPAQPPTTMPPSAPAHTPTAATGPSNGASPTTNAVEASGTRPAARSAASVGDPAEPLDSQSAFNARYEGFATEGATRNALQAEFTRQGDVVQGIYQYPNGQRGQIQGAVSGNQLTYEWRWGGYSGRGIASERAGTIQGTWGYGDSAVNAGIMVLQRSQL